MAPTRHVPDRHQRWPPDRSTETAVPDISDRPRPAARPTTDRRAAPTDEHPLLLAHGGLLTVDRLGTVAYRPTWELQDELAEQRRGRRIGDRLLLLEHFPVYTIGRGGDEANMLATPERLREIGAELDPDRPRRRHHLPRARPARGLPDRRAARSARPAPLRPHARGGGHRHRRRVRRRRGSPGRRSRASGSTASASWPPSACASGAASRPTGWRST